MSQVNESTVSVSKEPVKKKAIIEIFLQNCSHGFKIGIEQITPAMILGYTIVYILQATELLDVLSVVFTPVMNLFGLPGESVAVLISAFFAKASGCATGAMLYAEGVLTLGQACSLLPACILMGTLVGHYARIVLVTGTNKKWHWLLLLIPLFDAFLSIGIMRVIMTFMGVV